MNRYFKKYLILLVVLIGIQGLIITLVISQLPVILLKSGIELNAANYWTNLLSTYIPYLINIIFALIIFTDLTKNKIKAVPVVLLTLLSNFAGIIFFFFLINNKIDSNDK